MDASRFDQLTRELASGPSRRAVLKGVIGGLVAALGGGSALADHKPGHCAKAGQVPTAGKHCCTGLLPDTNGRCVTNLGCTVWTQQGRCCPSGILNQNDNCCCPGSIPGNVHCTNGLYSSDECEPYG